MRDGPTNQRTDTAEYGGALALKTDKKMITKYQIKKNVLEPLAFFGVVQNHREMRFLTSKQERESK